MCWFGLRNTPESIAGVKPTRGAHPKRPGWPGSVTSREIQRGVMDPGARMGINEATPTRSQRQMLHSRLSLRSSEKSYGNVNDATGRLSLVPSQPVLRRHSVLRIHPQRSHSKPLVSAEQITRLRKGYFHR